MLRSLLATSSALLAKYLRILSLSVLVVAVLYLVATGRLNWLLAAIGVTLAYVSRLLPILLSHAPHWQRLWQLFTAAKEHSGRQQETQQGAGTMSADEAYRVLGLQPGASEQEIVAAHRKLMQKNHPDHGGSDYLATKINLAKKTLLNK